MTGGSDESISNDSTHRIPAGRWMDWAKAKGWAVDEYGLDENLWPDVVSRLCHEPSCFHLRHFQLWDDRFLRTGEAEMDGLEVRLKGTICSFDEIDPDWHTGLATVRLRNARDDHSFAARTGLSVRPLARHIPYPHSLVFSIQVFSQALLEAIKWAQGQKRGISRAAPQVVVELRSGDTPPRLNTTDTTKAPAGEGEIAGAGETNHGIPKATEIAPEPAARPAEEQDPKKPADRFTESQARQALATTPHANEPLSEPTLEHERSKLEPERRLPRFDRIQAKVLLVAKKVSGEWRNPPTEAKSRAFLKTQFNGVPNDPHRKIRHEVWPGLIHRGRKSRSTVK